MKKEESKKVVKRNEPNLAMGLVGAICGSLIGVIIWVIIYKLGFIASFGGIAIAYGALLGFEKLGKGMDRKSLFICLTIVILSVWFANRVAWAIEVSLALEEYASFGQCFTYMSNLLEIFNLTESYYSDLFVGYVLTALGCYKMIINVFKNVK